MEHRSWYAKKLSQPDVFHTEDILHRSFCIQKLLHTAAFKTFTQRNFYPQKLLHAEAFPQRNLYTQKLLHTEAFTHRSFLTKKPLHRVAQNNLYAQTRLHTVAFTHRSFCTEKSLPIFHHVSFFMTIHHLFPSYLRFRALLVNSLRRLVFISHDVLSVHASSSLPLRRSKLNDNPGINSD